MRLCGITITVRSSRSGETRFSEEDIELGRDLVIVAMLPRRLHGVDGLDDGMHFPGERPELLVAAADNLTRRLDGVVGFVVLTDTEVTGDELHDGSDSRVNAFELNGGNGVM